MRNLAVRFAAALLKVLYHLCALFPTRNRWVLISRQSNRAPLDFRLIAQWCAQQEPPIQAVILAKQLHNPLAYIPEVFRQVFYLATSKAVVLDSYCIAVSLLGDTIQAPVVQIWHALGNMKKFGFTALDSEEGRNPEMARLLRMHEGYDAIAVSSLSFRDDFAAGFDADPSLLFEAPLPRTDLLTSQDSRDSRRATLLQQYPQLRGKKTVVYCPTFRKSPSPNTDQAMTALVKAVDFSRYNLVYKPHPVTTQVIEDSRVLTLRGNDPDPLFVADYVISDYSTVIYEAGLLDVPVYLYAYDWNTYSQKRGMNIDLERDVPTLFTDDPQKIMAAIEGDEFDFETYREFTRANVAVVPGATCTDNLCQHIAAMAQ
ncbi:MAG: CDP-glycerol glycerophosphotransferase family protein [Adlercreutzia sp.]|nr:CDP-glycerol glycerophosphotransferase family protein [Adlercreutzia sp.]